MSAEKINIRNLRLQINSIIQNKRYKRIEDEDKDQDKDEDKDN